MAGERNAKSDPDSSAVYQIRLTGHLGSEWADWFGGLTISLEDNGETLLTGPVIDQAALHGLLKKVCNLGMPLISVHRTVASQAYGSAESASARPAGWVETLLKPSPDRG
jgi:hypothetical protein